MGGIGGCAERKAERSAIERLIVGYEQNVVVLDDDKAKATRALGASRKLLSMIAPEPDPGITDEYIAPILLECMQNAKFIPVLGTTNSLFASGDLSLIGDPEIQRLLNQRAGSRVPAARISGNPRTPGGQTSVNDRMNARFLLQIVGSARQ